MSADRRVAAFLELAVEESGAARALETEFPRQSAYFAQQAVEKIARAVLAREAIPFGTSHNIGQMAAALPPGHPWRPKLAAFDRLSPAASSHRYPTPGGRLPPAPVAADLGADLAAIERLLKEAKKALGGK
jgi:HEPN domain-containing protein